MHVHFSINVDQKENDAINRMYRLSFLTNIVESGLYKSFLDIRFKGTNQFDWNSDHYANPDKMVDEYHRILNM